ncbi:TIGR00366 family protein [Microbacterium sp. APC 3898]|uniref:TIGR00366 family protein n=1 Tax=Planococcus notacanthi TaxID=3035188 RepID=A0ABT7ZEV4_9BACL|nr:MULTISPECIES: TIGR00366 family protein [Terrabacteria group]MDN3425688.1 TIGR00366 family protein [Planococcus sp. APC 4016]MDN3501030.1 TIGR00366 family protein [Microbacterium sp. APC 3898]
MLRKVSQRFNVGVENYLPNAFIFAILLTFLTLILGMTVTNQSLTDMTTHWYTGFWNFLAFTTQMILILITGYALVKAPPVQKLLVRMASIPKTQKSALIITILVAAAAGYISWGLGFVLGTLFAIEVAKNVKTADFRILIAAAYTGTIAILPASITVTAPLLVNTPGHSLEGEIGLIPLSETIFSPTLLLTAFIGLIVVLFVYIKMMPKQDEVIPFEKDIDVFVAPKQEKAKTFAEKLDRSKIINYVVVALGTLWLVQYVIQNGFNLELNILNFFFIILGLALHGTPLSYINAITAGMPSASGILLQFPFYAGIMGMMVGSGLITVISQSFVSISNEYTFPLLSFLSAAVVNVFVPSAGGQWQIQGPIMLEASRAFNIPISSVVNTVTIGDLVTNLMQPFFVLPALGLSGLGLKDIWGYCLVSMVLLMIVAGTIVTVIPLIF